MTALYQLIAEEVVDLAIASLAGTQIEREAAQRSQHRALLYRHRFREADLVGSESRHYVGPFVSLVVQAVQVETFPVDARNPSKMQVGPGSPGSPRDSEGHKENRRPHREGGFGFTYARATLDYLDSLDGGLILLMKWRPRGARTPGLAGRR